MNSADWHERNVILTLLFKCTNVTQRNALAPDLDRGPCHASPWNQEEKSEKFYTTPQNVRGCLQVLEWSTPTLPSKPALPVTWRDPKHLSSGRVAVGRGLLPSGQGQMSTVGSGGHPTPLRGDTVQQQVTPSDPASFLSLRGTADRTAVTCRRVRLSRQCRLYR